MFATLQEISPQDAGATGDGGNPLEERVKEFMARVADDAQLDSNKINYEDTLNKIGDEVKTPFQNSFL